MELDLDIVGSLVCGSQDIRTLCDGHDDLLQHSKILDDQIVCSVSRSGCSMLFVEVVNVSSVLIS